MSALSNMLGGSKLPNFRNQLLGSPTNSGAAMQQALAGLISGSTPVPELGELDFEDVKLKQ
jgi:hypothetical protein